jgi:DNA invertase Pin-like site-specific DNA recombinase
MLFLYLVVKYKGRAPTARRQQQQIIDLRAKGMTGEQVAKELGISRRSVYRLQSKDRLSLGSLA